MSACTSAVTLYLQLASKYFSSFIQVFFRHVVICPGLPEDFWCTRDGMSKDGIFGATVCATWYKEERQRRPLIGWLMPEASKESP